ncbi:hypothetical protein LWI28_026454 [Acer negundo]|uniref:Retrotransposon Copia-like N-terminal domain-containing protein n=1 Tax=Acer negundo TaxID=4023 RepID=A0AAD5NRK1_ACENE|nr:hypothetical protein LWI28_026454 [Acer negundo]
MAKNDERILEPTKPSTNKYEDPSDPFYLHHSDQPSLIFVTQLLTQHNYPILSHAMLIALTTKNKDEFVDGTITKPPFTSAKEYK